MVGRDRDNTLVLRLRQVSRFHALLMRDAAEILLIDLEGTNGARVNGVSVHRDEPVRLADGGELCLGDVVVRYCAR